LGSEGLERLSRGQVGKHAAEDGKFHAAKLGQGLHVFNDNAQKTCAFFPPKAFKTRVFLWHESSNT
jgi:hypothetical protein